ncbi:hypothetical protein Pla163_35940 [Planctomycetes bacterium Pla163]|uniref:DUF2029 domain-containing protein n=1 Tax=Rohdeia mirabilis TaxID=2528008 RepID=A0A518D4P4_9BACT|nr:hypothetical protein Pla163_35940 [Planctomycetes bacterium Pla163]
MQRYGFVALGLVLAILTLVRVADKAQRGKQALIKWTPQLEQLVEGRDVYERSDSGLVRTEGAAKDGTSAEGFPTPPISGLLLAPFAQLGPVPGSLAFAALKIVLASFALTVALAIAFEPGRAPTVAALLVLAGVLRVWSSDLAHGNTNLLVLGAIAAALLAWHRRMEALGGLWIALAAALKVTPLLLLALPLARRSRAGLIGFGAGCVFFLVAVPGAMLGPTTALELLGAWGRQMFLPYLEGRELTLLVTEHTNQSLLGVLARWFTDATAIEARPDVWAKDLGIGVAHLSADALHWLHRVLALGVLGISVLALRPFARGDESADRDADGGATLRAFAILCLAMLLLSERSWKQHYVVLVFPLAHLVSIAWLAVGARRAWAVAALATSALLHGLTGSGTLGDRGSDLAEAYGAWFLGAVVLWVACIALQRPSESVGAPSPGSR